MNTIEIVTTPEHAISGEVRSQLRTLLDACFPGTLKGRTYFKQLPHMRLLAMDGGSVVGQVGVDGRVVNVGGTLVSIFGLIDLAVQPAFTQWLAIEDRQSVELTDQDLSDCFLAKPLTEKTWPAGRIDMLGYLF